MKWNPRSSAKKAAAWTTDPSAKRDHAYVAMVAEDVGAEVSTPARKITEVSNRRLVEFCCSVDSVLGHRRYVEAGCVSFRLTIQDDLTTQQGLERALEAVEGAADDEYVHLWGALPCTGGSPWQNLNKRYPSARAKIQMHLATFQKLIKNFKKVARAVIARGGDVSFEWPTGCSLWRTTEVTEMIEEMSLNRVNMHGCAARLVSKDGVPIKKPWTIATTSSALYDALETLTCPGTTLHPVHAPCAGSETKKTELYTRTMADAVHNAIREEALSSRANHAMAVIPEMESEFDDSYRELDSFPEPSGHRPRIGSPGLWCAMITKTLAPNDPLCRSKGALESIDKELTNLRQLPTWDEENPMEAEEVSRQDPLAHFARIFPIVGIKNFEDELTRIFKGRIA